MYTKYMYAYLGHTRSARQTVDAVESIENAGNDFFPFPFSLTLTRLDIVGWYYFSTKFNHQSRVDVEAAFVRTVFFRKSSGKFMLKCFGCFFLVFMRVSIVTELFVRRICLGVGSYDKQIDEDAAILHY